VTPLVAPSVAEVRAAYQAAWRRALGADGKLRDNLRAELAGLPPRPRDLAMLHRAVRIRSARLARTPPCDHAGPASGCEFCAWLDPAWCLVVAWCDPDADETEFF
jgi:hypothetical protein